MKNIIHSSRALIGLFFLMAGMVPAVAEVIWPDYLIHLHGSGHAYLSLEISNPEGVKHE